METSMKYHSFCSFTEIIQKKENPTESELSSAHEEFVNHLSLVASSELSIIGKLRKMRQLELELATYRNGKYSVPDNPTTIYLTKAVALVRTEIDLLHFAVDHPECHAVPPPVSKRGNTTPSLHWKSSLVNLMELITSLDYSGFVTDEKGNRHSFSALVTAFETFFHVTFSKPYDLRADLARRKKSLSVLLPKLKENYEKNIVNCGIDRR